MNTNAMLALTLHDPITPRVQRARLLVAVMASLVLFGAASVVPADDTTRVSVSSAGGEGGATNSIAGTTSR